MKAEVFFIAATTPDGKITTLPTMPDEGIEVDRPVNNFDIYQTCKQIVDEFESTILAQKVADVLTERLGIDNQPSTAEKIASALKERGIKPESK
jgi:hypothetical protein